MEFKLHQPAGLLASFVEGMVYYADWMPDHAIERLLPDGAAHLIIELDGIQKCIYDNETLLIKKTYCHSWVSGLHTQFLSLSAELGSSMMVIRFQPGGLRAFARVSMAELVDRVEDAHLLFGKDIEYLREELLHQPTAEAKFLAVESWLLRRIRTASIPESVARIVALSITSDPSAQKLMQLAHRSGYSQKHLIDLFRTNIGLAPKEFQKIIRFNQALREIESRKQILWSDLAYDLQYADQAHFIREFKRFSGFSPGSFLKERIDFTNYVVIR